ncbi:MAG: histidinol-phosphate transaminase [Bacteroidales bacterium]|nr:histidinol-phosphate transaminase [Bacteroidales bacterium]
MFDINNLIRENIRRLVPYSSARDEFQGEDAIFLDANENPYNTTLNRYPDPRQIRLKQTIAAIKNVPADKIFLGNGSDEAIDLLIRAFCEPGTDNIVSIKPTYGMYKVCADINNVEFREVLLTADFQPDTAQLLKMSDANSKLLFLCSPNNPTSNSLNKNDVVRLIEEFPGLVIIDEAYIDFSTTESFAGLLDRYPNLVILQTFSKAWGMAGVRLGMAFAAKEIIAVLNRIKYPYNINILTQRTALERLNDTASKDKWISMIIKQRDYLARELAKLPMVKRVLPSDANFLMARFDNPREIFAYLTAKKIIVRDRSKVSLCEGFLRITVGTEAENLALISALQQY